MVPDIVILPAIIYFKIYSPNNLHSDRLNGIDSLYTAPPSSGDFEQRTQRKNLIMKKKRILANFERFST